MQPRRRYSWNSDNSRYLWNSVSRHAIPGIEIIQTLHSLYCWNSAKVAIGGAAAVYPTTLSEG
jgi:hypothetical protein